LSGCRLVLDIAGGSEKGKIILWNKHGGDNQKWYFDEDFTIRSGLGFVLDVEHASTDNSSGLLAFAKHGKDNQKFRIVPADD
jgi:hypothetical protein